MAEPYDYLLAEYIRLGKIYAKSINSTDQMALYEAITSTKNKFDNTYTDEEYNEATVEAETYVLVNYNNLFTRIPD